MSSVDISLCSSTIVDRFEWNVSDELYSSDHFPIIISYLQNDPRPYEPQYNINKADWQMYEYLTRQIDPFDDLKDHNEIDKYITEFMLRAADESIPKTSPNAIKKYLGGQITFHY